MLIGKPHHDYGYILEAFLWSRVSSNRNWMDRFSTIRAVGHSLKLRARDYGLQYTCAIAIQRCYDAERPYLHRLRALGKALSKVSRLPTVDRELLVWAAATRWLARTKAYGLAAVTLAEYEGLSLRLTYGASTDSLGMMQDMADRPWYQDPGAEAAPSVPNPNRRSADLNRAPAPTLPPLALPEWIGPRFHCALPPEAVQYGTVSGRSAGV